MFRILVQGDEATCMEGAAEMCVGWSERESAGTWDGQPLRTGRPMARPPAGVGANRSSEGFLDFVASSGAVDFQRQRSRR